MVASKTLSAHIARGIIAAALIIWAFSHQSSHPGIAVAAGVVAFFAMRGCPMCWTLGLIATIAQRLDAPARDSVAVRKVPWSG